MQYLRLVLLALVLGSLHPITPFFAHAEVAKSVQGLSRPEKSSVKFIKRSPEFNVPEGLRERVNFWIGIFARYGKYVSVFHHRIHPQAIFEVLDMTLEGKAMSAAQFERYKSARLKEKTQEIKSAINWLANGGAPRNVLERRIVNAMKLVPSDGRNKYRRLLDEDLLRSQTGIKERYQDAVVRSGRYLPFMERIFVEEYGLPVELTRLPFVESSFDYTAYSSVGAAGIWQFMPRTARSYMRVNSLVDERRDPVISTRAAARYLTSAYRSLGSWPLAVTSYNHGVGGVSGKVKRFGSRDIVYLIENSNQQAFGFASSNFYPEFLAAVEIYERYQSYFPGIRVEPELRVKEVKLMRPTSVRYVTNQLGISSDELRKANYALSKSVWDGRHSIPANYVLKIPLAYSAKIERLKIPESKVQVVAPASSAVTAGLTYRVRSGDTLIKIARKYGVTVANLRANNKLKNDRLKIGQVLTIKPVSATSTKTKSAKAPAPQAKAKSRTVVVKSGQSLWSISQRTGVTVTQLKRYNNLKSNKLKPGQVLKLGPN